MERKSGTQSVERAIRLLVELSRRTTGWRMSDLARECELDLATVHRLLRALSSAGLAVRRESDRHYLVGPEVLNIGLAAGYHGSLVLAARTVAREVAAATRQVAFVYLRSGDDFTCVARGGRSALKGLTVHVGTRRPLAVSAGGVAMLLRLDAAEQKRVLAENLRRVRRVGEQRARGVERMWQRSLQAGYGLNRDDIAPELSSVAVATVLPAPWSLASVVITGPSAALDGSAIAAAARVLRGAALALEQRAGAIVAPSSDGPGRSRSSFEA
jgi:DNA-binding IclR family transcriptional regulator